jgi:hypothetical protein
VQLPTVMTTLGCDSVHRTDHTTANMCSVSSVYCDAVTLLSGQRATHDCTDGEADASYNAASVRLSAAAQCYDDMTLQIL